MKFISVEKTTFERNDLFYEITIAIARSNIEKF